MWRFAVPVLISGSMAFGNATLQLALHSVSQDESFVNVYDPGPATFDASEGEEFTVSLFVRARLFNDVTAIGLTAFEGRLTDDGSGAWSKSPLTIYDTLGVPGIPGLDFSGRTGMTPDYRDAFQFNGNDDPLNGAYDGLGGWTFFPISTTGVRDAFQRLDDVYRVDWTTTDLTPRTVTLTVDAASAGYHTAAGVVGVDSINPGVFTIRIIPAPSAAAFAGCCGTLIGRRRR